MIFPTIHLALTASLTLNPPPEPEEPTSKPAPRSPIGLSAAISTAFQVQQRRSEVQSINLIRAGYTLPKNFDISLRWGWISSNVEDQSTVLVAGNPAWEVGFTAPLPKQCPACSLRVSVGTTVPIGGGSGNDADPKAAEAILMGTNWAGPVYAPNHLATIVGSSFSLGWPRLSFSGSMHLNMLFRVRGEALDPFGERLIFTFSTLAMNFAATEKLGFWLGPAETRYLNHPDWLEDNEEWREDRYLFAGGWYTFSLGETLAMNVALTYCRGIDAPKAPRRYQVGELALGFEF